MDSLRICSGCSYIFCFVDNVQDTCVKCGASLRELTPEEASLILSTNPPPSPGHKCSNKCSH